MALSRIYSFMRALQFDFRSQPVNVITIKNKKEKKKRDTQIATVLFSPTKANNNGKTTVTECRKEQGYKRDTLH